MKFFKRTRFLFAALVVLLSLAACKAADGDDIILGSDNFTAEPTLSPTEPEVVDNSSAGFAMDYSAGIDENGYWEGVNARDCVTSFEYVGIEIPYATHTVSDAALQAEVDKLLSSYKTSVQVMDRAVVDGDMVNIDYVGSVDGVEFDGGTTGGGGADVTIGVTQYIDDFLQQVIGHMPGDKFDIHVTFPENYSSAELSGKDAVFATTLNYISESVIPELTDEFVGTNMSSVYGWTNVVELEAAITESLSSSAITRFIQQYILTNTTVKTIPDFITKYKQDEMIAFYNNYATQYNMELEAYLAAFLGVESVESLLEAGAAEIADTILYALALQTIAEDLELKVSESDMQHYFIEFTGSPDYLQYEPMYGRPYLVQMVLGELVMEFLTENAVLLSE